LEHDLGASPLRPVSPAADMYDVDDGGVDTTTFAPFADDVSTPGGVSDDVRAASPAAVADGAADADGDAPLPASSATDDLQRDDGVTYQPSPSVDNVPVNLMSVPPVDLEHFAVLCSRFMWCNSTAPIDTILHSWPFTSVPNLFDSMLF